MPRSKAQSPSEESMEGHKARRRVVKACQRCRLKKCKSFRTSSALEPAHYGQTLTHKILEALGVLQGDEWDDNNGEGFENDPSWQNFDIHQSNSQDYASMYDDSHTTSPATQTTFSPMSATQATFPHSTIMAKRRGEFQDANGGMTTSQMLSMPPLLNTNLPPYHPGHVQSSTFQIPLPLSTFSHDNEDSGFGHMNWACFGVDELFANPNVQPLQVAS